MDGGTVRLGFTVTMPETPSTYLERNTTSSWYSSDKCLETRPGKEHRLGPGPWVLKVTSNYLINRALSLPLLTAMKNADRLRGNRALEPCGAWYHLPF